MWIQAELDQRNLFCRETGKGEPERGGFSGSYTPCNLIFMTVGDANMNTCASSVTLNRAEWVFIQGQKACSTFYSTLRSN